MRLQVAWPQGDIKPGDSAEQALVYAHQLAGEHLCERHVLRVVGLGPAEVVCDALGGLDQTVGRSDRDGRFE